MNYLKVYCNLIRKAEKRTPPKGYVEKHHTFPKSIFGKNNRVVVLTAREHYIAHALLEKICIKRYGLEHWKTKKMNFAHLSMKSDTNRYYNSYLYESARNRISYYMKNRVVSEETKNKISISRSGENNPNFGKQISEEHKNKLLNSWKGRKHTQESKLKMSESKKGKSFTEKHRKKLSECKKGENHFLYGKKRSDEVVNKIVEKKSKNFSIISPDGEIIYGKNIAEFCRENNLDKATICNMLNYKRGIKSHKGYRAVPQNI
jgi:hypothetical protein